MAAKVIDRLFSQGCLCDLRVSYWTGAKQFRPEDIGIERGKLPDALYTLGKRQLVDRDEIRTFVRLETAARRTVRNSGFTFPVGGASFIPSGAIEDLNLALSEIRDEWNASVDSLLSRYDALRVHMLGEWRRHLTEWREYLGNGRAGVPPIEDLMDRVAGLYLDPGTIKTKFAFDWKFFSVSFGGESASYSVNAQAGRERQDILAEQRQAADREIREWLGQVVRGVKESALAIVESWQGMLGRDRTISTASVEALMTYVERFQRLNFIGDRELEKAVEDMREALPSEAGPIGVDDDETRGRIGTALKGMETAAKAAASAAIASVVDRFTGDTGRKVRRKAGAR